MRAPGNRGKSRWTRFWSGPAGPPTWKTLDLEAAGVQYEAGRGQGVVVNDHLQTTNRRIYAAGDVCLPYKFTHLADATARIVIQNALFLGPQKDERPDHPLVHLHRSGSGPRGAE